MVIIFDSLIVNIISISLDNEMLFWKQILIVLQEQHFGFVPVFFSYAADVGLFLETGKGLTCAVLRKVLTSGRIDKYGITFWKAPQNSCVRPKRMVFTCPQARAYDV